MAILRDKTGTALSSRNPLYVDVTDQSSRVTDVSAELVQFVVAATNSNDAGEAAGVVVYGRLTNSGVLNSAKVGIGNFNDSSATLTSTALTTEVEFPFAIWNNEKDTRSRATKIAAVGATLANGEFCIYYASGLIIGKKTDTSTTGTIDYSYRTTSSSVIEGGGDASAANQDEQTSLLTTIDADTDAIKTAVEDIQGSNGAIATTSSNVLTALQVMDDWDNAASDGASVSGDTAHDAIDAGEPVKIGGKAADPTSLPNAVAAGDRVDASFSTKGEFLTYLTGLIAGEDLTNDVLKVEHQYSYSAVAVADTQVKATAGFLHAVTISCNDAAPTAGSLIIYDNTAESGAVVFNHTFTTTPFVPFTVIFDIEMATGIYVGMTTTGDVNFSCSFR